MKNKQPPAIHILSLGDSYTIGTGVEPNERWPYQLSAALRDEGFDTSEPVYIAQNGWTTTDLLEAISSGKTAGKFDLVSLLIGVNNQYQGLSINRYTREFSLLLQQAIEYANGSPDRVMVLSIPDWSVTPFAAGLDRLKISREIDLYNSVNYRLSSAARTGYIEITSFVRRTGARADSLADDGLHPSPRMYAGWVKLAMPVVLRSVVQRLE